MRPFRFLAGDLAGRCAFIGLALCATLVPSGAAADGLTERISVGFPERSQGDGNSRYTSISADGRFVAFSSSDSNLVRGDANAAIDVFVHDRQTGEVTLVSVGSQGGQGNGRSSNPAISADGRFVAFGSLATNLVPGDTNGCADVFVHDRLTGTTERVSVDALGDQGTLESYFPSISGDGRLVAFSSDAPNLVPGDTNGVGDVFVHDRQTGETGRVSLDSSGNQGDAWSLGIDISADGRLVSFVSQANWTAGEPRRLLGYVHDRQTGETALVSVDSSGTHGDDNVGMLRLSADGRFVAFSWLDLSGQGDLFVHELQTRQTTRVSLESNAAIREMALSADGRFVAYATDLPPDAYGTAGDLFVYDRLTGAKTLVDVDLQGGGRHGSGEPSLSADGRYVAFSSTGQDLVPGDGNGGQDIFVRDLLTAQTERLNLGPVTRDGHGQSRFPAISADGNFVAFVSEAPNLVPGDDGKSADIFVHARRTGAMRRVSVSSSGALANANSGDPRISGNGRLVAFTSDASNLVPGDTNEQPDIFVHDLLTHETERVSVDSRGNQGNWGAFDPGISVDGRFVTFSSISTNLVPNDTNGWSDVYVHDRQTRTTTRVSVDPAGNQANGHSHASAISGDGRFVVFYSLGDNLLSRPTDHSINLFVHDRQTGETKPVNVDPSGRLVTDGYESVVPAISADGRFVAFNSLAAGIVADDTNQAMDVFVRDLQAGRTVRVSVDSAGREVRGTSCWPALSADGRFVAFRSWSDQLVPGDTNGTWDEFVHDLLTGETKRVSVDSSGNQSLPGGGNPYRGSTISGDGSLVAFSSPATDLVPDKLGVFWDVYVHGATERLVFFDDFRTAAPAGDPRWTEIGGDWSVQGAAKSLTSPPRRTALAIVQDTSVGLHPLEAGRIEINLRMLRLLTPRSHAGVVFGYQDPAHYRYVRFRPGRMIIGQVGDIGADKAGVRKTTALPLTLGKWSRLSVRMQPNGSVSVFRGTRLVGRQRFSAPLSGGVGLSAHRTLSQFDNVRVWDASAAP